MLVRPKTLCQRPSRPPSGRGQGRTRAHRSRLPSVAKTVGSGPMGPGQGHAEPESFLQIRTTWHSPGIRDQAWEDDSIVAMLVWGLSHTCDLSCWPSTAVLTHSLIIATHNELLDSDSWA